MHIRCCALFCKVRPGISLVFFEENENSITLSKWTDEAIKLPRTKSRAQAYILLPDTETDLRVFDSGENYKRLDG